MLRRDERAKLSEGTVTDAQPRSTRQPTTELETLMLNCTDRIDHIQRELTGLRAAFAALDERRRAS